MKFPRIKRALGAAVSAAILATAAACSSSPAPAAAALTYAPAAYGVAAVGGYDCYYIESPAEVATLIAAHRCPNGSIPTQMPLAWEETYWAYYDSPAYYNAYMPVATRTVFVKSSTTFSTRYKSQITLYSSKGTYTSSTGQKVTGTSAAKLKFNTTTGSGSATTVHGGGSLRRSCALAMTALTDKGGSGSSTTTVHGGGSARTGSSSSNTRTTSGSGAKGGC